MEKEKLKDYCTPDVDMIEIKAGQVFCGSPQAGGNEDVGYEDWII